MPKSILPVKPSFIVPESTFAELKSFDSTLPLIIINAISIAAMKYIVRTMRSIFLILFLDILPAAYPMKDPKAMGSRLTVTKFGISVEIGDGAEKKSDTIDIA